MIFLAFCGETRDSIVQVILYHFKNYGFNIWYDNHNLILGDLKRDNIFELGLNKCEYAIMIYSQGFTKCKSFLEEEKRILQLFSTNSINIFPIFYEIDFSHLPNKQQELFENIIYNEIKVNDGQLLLTINQIIVRILKGRLGKSSALLSDYLNRIKDDYLLELLKAYIEVDKVNFNSRISLLYAMHKYIEYSCKSEYNFEIINYLNKFTKLNIGYNFKEIEIAELSLINLINLKHYLLFH